MVGLSTLCHSCGFACKQGVLKTFPGPGFLESEDGVVWLWHPLANLYIRLTISSGYDSIPLALWLIGRDDVLITLCHSGGISCKQRMLKIFPGPVYFHSEDGVVWLWHPLGNLYVCLTISSCYDSIRLAWALIVRDGVLRTLCHSCGFSCQQRVLKTFSGPDSLQSEDGVIWLWHPLVNLYIWLTISSCYGSIPLGLGLIVRDGGLSTLCHSCGSTSQKRALQTFPDPGYFQSEDGVVLLWPPLLNFYIWLTIPSCYGSIPLGLGSIGRDGGLRTLCHSCVLAFQQSMLKAFPGSGYLLSEDGAVWLWNPLVNLYIWFTVSSCYDSIPFVFGLTVRDGALSTLCHSCGFSCQHRVLKTFPGPDFLQSEDEVVWLWHQLVNLYIWLTISSCYGSIPLGLALIVRDGGLSTLCHSCGFASQKRVQETFPGPGYLHSEDGVVWL